MKRIQSTVVNGIPGWLIPVPNWLFRLIEQAQEGREGVVYEAAILAGLALAWCIWV